jgi:transcription initiation factor TFIID TATA-box-binding protein
MLMPHEMVGPSATASSNGSLVGQHSLHSPYSGDHMHHASQFYHHSASTGFNGFHNSYHSYSTLNNGTMLHNGHTTFSNLIHQQAPMNNNHHHHHHSAMTLPSTVTPLIHQQIFYGSDKSHHQQSTDQSSLNQTTAISDLKEEETPATDETSGEVALPVEDATPEEPEPEIDIVISNVVCAFSVRCQLALKEIALNGANVEFKRENGMVTMKLRKPYTTASIWSSGKITCTGATSEDQVK